MTQLSKHHSVTPVQSRNPVTTYCAVCHKLLVRNEQGHWVHSRDPSVQVRTKQG